MTSTFYHGLFEERDPRQPFFQSYWAHGRHLGHALERMRSAALGNGLRAPAVRVADPASPTALPAQVARSRDGSVLWALSRHLYPPEEEDAMALPTGIVVSGRDVEGSLDPDDIRPSYRITRTADLHELEVNVPEGRLAADYLAFLEALGPFTVFWYAVHGHWSGADGSRLYVNRQLVDATSIGDHLASNRADSLENGYVTTTAYLAEGQTNVNVSDHKALVVLTKSGAILARATELIRALGYRRCRPFVTVATRIPHWHFRPRRSRRERDLIRKLAALGFERWDPAAPRR